MGLGQEVVVFVIWIEIFLGKFVVYEDIKYEQVCIFYNFGVLYFMLGVMDKWVFEEGMKVFCIYFQCVVGVFVYLWEYFF